ncbi:hypothetical protein NFI96_012493 [Prochilodus magdalenae]|nr:hypothetical protein NFI96_012493 [Prochilodus magdalenae]
MTKILTACVGVLVLLAMHFSTQVSCQNSSIMTNATSFASTTISTITSRNGTNHTTPNGAGSMVLPAGLSLLLPIGLLSSVLHGHCGVGVYVSVCVCATLYVWYVFALGGWTLSTVSSFLRVLLLPATSQVAMVT